MPLAFFSRNVEMTISLGATVQSSDGVQVEMAQVEVRINCGSILHGYLNSLVPSMGGVVRRLRSASFPW